jgi:predicted TIM-barrel fold metal-dependent hydrolase
MRTSRCGTRDPENQKNVQGRQFIDCFYDYHRNLSPESEVWSYEDYLYQGGERLMKDLFEDGYVDHAIFQPAYLHEFYHRGFGQTQEASALAAAHPDKLTYNHYFDPRDGEAGLDRLRAAKEKFGLKGVKLYTAEWHGDSRGYKLSDPETYRYLELCRELDIRNIHVHKGPTIRPLDRDAFDVADVDHAATDFTDLNFVVEHVGLPRSRTSAGSPRRSRTSTAGSPSRCRSSTPVRATSRRSSASSCTGSVRTASSSPPTTRCGRRSGSSRRSSTSRSPRT